MILNTMASSSMSIQSCTNSVAFQAAGRAMAELGVAGCIGSVCVQREYLTADMVAVLSKTCFSILLPMFLGTNILKSASNSNPMVPLLAVMHCFVLYVTSKFITLPLFGMDANSDTGRSTVVCCSFGNSGVVPFIFLEALFRNQPNVLSECVAQVSLYLMGWSPFFWSFGRNVLVNDDDDDTPKSGGGGIQKLFSPPIVGTMIGLILSPFRSLFLGENAPLAVVYNSFANLGRAANPLALLVLTASLALGKSESSSTTTLVTNKNKETISSEATFLQKWACVSTTRFFVSPLLMWTLLAFVSPDGGVDKNPYLYFVLLLQSCMPSAQNSVLMLQVAKKRDQAIAMARFLFSIYAAAMIPVVLIVTVLLQYCNLGSS